MLDPVWARAKNILAMRLDNIGDVILSTPALYAIKENLPEAHLTLLASPAGSQLASMLPFVDKVIARKVVWQDVGGRMPLDPEREFDLVRTVADEGFDAAVIFTSFSQSPYPPAYVCYLAGVRLRLGQSKEFGGSLLTHELRNMRDTIHQAERSIRLVESVGFTVKDRYPKIAVPEWAEESARVKLRDRGISPEEGYAIIHPGSSCPARTWHWERFAEAGSLLYDETALPIVVTGDKHDIQRAEAIVEAARTRIVSLAGETTLEEFAAVIKMARVLISNNTSTVHFAAALKSPMVILFAGTELECQWKPYGAPVTMLRRSTPCCPCYLFECPTQHECLDITPEEAAEAAVALLS